MSEGREQTTHVHGVDQETVAVLVDRLGLRNLRARELGVSYRQLNYWESNGLLFAGADRKGHTGWRTFSLVDLFWVQLTRSLRDWGISAEVLKAMKAQLETPIRAEAAANAPPLFALILAEFIITRINLNLLVRQEGTFQFYNPAHPDSFDETTRRFFQEHHLSVSLAGVFHAVLLQEGFTHPLFNLPGLFSPSERQLLREVSLGQVTYLKVFPLNEVGEEADQLSRASMQAFLVPHLLGWPYERIDYRYEAQRTHQIYPPAWDEREQELIKESDG